MRENNNENRNKLKENILKCEFKIAYEKYVKNLTFYELDNLLAWLGFTTQNILVYAFACYLITVNDCVDYHNIAQMVMSNPLCHIKGAYKTALYHNKRVLELEPENIRAMEMMLFYNQLPDALVNKKSAINYAKKF